MLMADSCTVNLVLPVGIVCAGRIIWSSIFIELLPA
ncbi:Uncharacterised protein [Segatella copri]|nr:Uncharacterised protein [Segatella copri]